LFLVDAAFAGMSPDALEEDLDNHLRVSPQALLSFVSRYFIPQNRVILELGTR
jgi:glutamate/tyrosine decarboxylase-like PLP-dependent enzyme